MLSPTTPPDTAGDTLAAAETALRARRSAEAEILRLAAHWADQHPGESIGQFGYTPKGAERAITIGGEGTPKVQEFCPAELGISLELHPLAARSLVADVLDLRHRLPSLWLLTTVELAVPDWAARKIAKLTRELTYTQVAEVDRRVAELATTLPPSRLFAAVEAMVLAADNETADRQRKTAAQTRFVALDREAKSGIRHLYARLSDTDALTIDAAVARIAAILGERGDEDTLDVRRAKALGILGTPALALKLLAGADPDAESSELARVLAKLPADKLGPQTTLYLHLTESDFTRDADGVARFEQGGPITLDHARQVLGHGHITIKPVIDLTHRLSSDSYEFTGSLREAVLLRTTADCFPYAVNTSGRRDIDHTVPYDPLGPPGQTNTANASPLTRHHHRIKTHGQITLRQPRPGLYIWRTRHHRYRATDHLGTRTIDPHLGAVFFGASELEARLATLLLDAA